ncbi:MAG: hypothetical protein BGO82_02130 [Devosia sp. 67-54]|uniref:MFS transporter n=1 Tax=unclassified Devosia TaxID=196773 RepID=UPI00086B66D0|nr:MULTISPECIES: MFS transporter [unclassified Devosia]MBN9305732.1 MFS transporter [Devosia sp.]ODU57903.1 MAG: hypothetical protein ABS99_04640 [Acetobacteraceae bacterium SCN 69-10]OJX16552.1 MAG: hypothetical protein BGO82_02130 [Devosia sp. 67-54]
MSTVADGRSLRTGWFELVLLAAAQLMLVLDVTVVNVALPDLVRDLHAPAAQSGLVIVVYGALFGGLLLVGGRAADRFGPRRVLLVGLVLFTGASLLAGFSVSMPMLLGARAVQGIGAALLSPSALASLTLRFDGAARTRALGAWAAVGGIGSALGVILGGLLTAGPGWRWIFFLNVPIGVLVLAVLPLIPTPVRRSGRTAGALATIGLLLRRQTVQAGTVAMLAATGLLVGSFFLASFTLQRALGWSPLQTGLAFLPMAIGTLAGAHMAGHGIAHIGSKPLVAAAFVLAGLGIGVGITAGQPFILIAGLTVASAGIGAAFVAAGVTSLSGVEQGRAGVASALLNTAHELGGAAAVWALTAVAGAALQVGFAGLAALGFIAAAVMTVLMPSIKPKAGSARFVH